MPKHSFGVITIESPLRALMLHPGVPTFTVSEYRKAHPSGRFGCGSCGEPIPPWHRFEYLEEEYEPDTKITIQLEHNFYLDNERPEDYVPAAEAPAPIHAILFEEGTRETYVPSMATDDTSGSLASSTAKRRHRSGRTAKSGTRPAISALRRR